jgi:hypothetical protein
MFGRDRFVQAAVGLRSVWIGGGQCGDRLAVADAVAAAHRAGIHVVDGNGSIRAQGLTSSQVTSAGGLASGRRPPGIRPHVGWARMGR